MCNECDYSLGYEPKKEPEKCPYEDGCRADFFKELVEPYDVKNMQEFIEEIQEEAIYKALDIVLWYLYSSHIKVNQQEMEKYIMKLTKEELKVGDKE